jgi:hypothetical protein
MRKLKPLQPADYCLYQQQLRMTAQQEAESQTGEREKFG